MVDGGLEAVCFETIGVVEPADSPCDVVHGPQLCACVVEVATDLTEEGALLERAVAVPRVHAVEGFGARNRVFDLSDGF